MQTNISSKALRSSSKDQILLIDAYLQHTNIQVHRLLEWSQVTFPESWKLPHISPAKSLLVRRTP